MINYLNKNNAINWLRIITDNFSISNIKGQTTNINNNNNNKLMDF